MSRDRYVLLGLARPRSSWFGNVAQWTTSGAVPAEFHKCLSAAQVRLRLASNQPNSALLVEDSIAETDRDLIEVARRTGIPTIVITGDDDSDKWLELGAIATLPPSMNPSTLLQTLSTHAQMIGSSTTEQPADVTELFPDRQGRLIAVCGAGGTGTSTVAIAISQALASNVTETDHVLLADFARNNEQGMLHDSPDVMPGVEEAVDLSRRGRPKPEQLRELTFAVEQRGYRLLLGQRRIDSWTAMPPHAINQAIVGLRRCFNSVVADITADFEGESDGGSIDVEERNAFARITTRQANVVVVVGSPGMKGVHSLIRVIRQLVTLGVDENRILPVITRVNRKPFERSEITNAIHSLSRKGSPSFQCNAPVFLPDRSIETSLRDGTRLDKHIVTPIGSAVEALLEKLPTQTASSALPPEPITPGSLGTKVN